MPLLRCPTCERHFDPDESQAVPFCSTQCRLIDLGRWLKEEHYVTVERDEDDEELELSHRNREEDE
jgi:endogenous inhibitor of DNA gyrase (YacG/DUF329 family)